MVVRTVALTATKLIQVHFGRVISVLDHHSKVRCIRVAIIFELVSIVQNNMAIAQPHEAVIGTAKKHVSDNYTLGLNQEIVGCFDIVF